jgi:hypothetical protein
MEAKRSIDCYVNLPPISNASRVTDPNTMRVAKRRPGPLRIWGLLGITFSCSEKQNATGYLSCSILNAFVNTFVV